MLIGLFQFWVLISKVNFIMVSLKKNFLKVNQLDIFCLNLALVSRPVVIKRKTSPNIFIEGVNVDFHLWPFSKSSCVLLAACVTRHYAF